MKGWPIRPRSAPASSSARGFLAALPEAAGLALDRIEVASPYDGRLHLNLYSFLRTIPAHQRRHLWVAERTRMVLAQADALEVAL